MKKIIFLFLSSLLLLWIISCSTVEAPVIIPEDTSLSGSSEVEGQDIIDQIRKISEEIEWTPEVNEKIQQEETPPTAVPGNPWIRE